jgi:hypothetical protein
VVGVALAPPHGEPAIDKRLHIVSLATTHCPSISLACPICWPIPGVVLQVQAIRFRS